MSVAGSSGASQPRAWHPPCKTATVGSLSLLPAHGNSATRLRAGRACRNTIGGRAIQEDRLFLPAGHAPASCRLNLRCVSARTTPHSCTQNCLTPKSPLLPLTPLAAPELD